MPLLIGPTTRPQGAGEAVAAAFRGLVALAPHHVCLTPISVPEEPGVEAWAWELKLAAPTVRDLGAIRFEMNDRGRTVFPTGDSAHPRIDRGVVLSLEGHWMVVASDAQGGADGELTLLGIDHVEQWLAGEVPASHVM